MSPKPRAPSLPPRTLCVPTPCLAATPSFLTGGSNVLVHLRPSPVVLRVMTGTVMLHSDPEAWLAAEVAVGAFLGGGLDVASSELLPAGPHWHDGLWMTSWAFVGHDDDDAGLPEPAQPGAASRALHEACSTSPARCHQSPACATGSMAC